MKKFIKSLAFVVGLLIPTLGFAGQQCVAVSDFAKMVMGFRQAGAPIEIFNAPLLGIKDPQERMAVVSLISYAYSFKVEQDEELKEAMVDFFKKKIYAECLGEQL